MNLAGWSLKWQVFETVLLHGQDGGAVKQLRILGAGFERFNQHVQSRSELLGLQKQFGAGHVQTHLALGVGRADAAQNLAV